MKQTNKSMGMALAAALMLAACSSEDNGGLIPVQTEGPAVRFTASQSTAGQTRSAAAVSEKTTYKTDNGFVITESEEQMALGETRGTRLTTIPSNFRTYAFSSASTGVTVSSSTAWTLNGNGATKPDGTLVSTTYWDSSKPNARFYGVWPLDLTAAVSGTDFTLSYTLPTDAADQIDIMAACSEEINWDAVNSPEEAPTVDLAFNHLLSAIRLVKGDNLSGYTLTKVEVTNAYIAGDYILQTANTATTAAIDFASCTVSGATATITLDNLSIAADNVADGNLLTGADTDAYTIFMIPQERNGVVITATFTNGTDTQKATISPTTGKYNPGYYRTYTVSLPEPDPYVDLGLSVKWASVNVGATVPADYGNYYAWGEIDTKATYDWTTYKYANGTQQSLTKYNNNNSWGAVDNLSTLEDGDDVAVQDASWGKGSGAITWRMPTSAEVYELVSNCRWVWVEATPQSDGTYNRQNDGTTYVAGYKVLHQTDDTKFIFLPAAGSWGSSASDVGTHGYYWSRTVSTSNPRNAMRLYFTSTNETRSNASRVAGYTVRPVYVSN